MIPGLRGGYVYCSESIALFAAMTVKPDGSRRKLIDQTIRSLKNYGIWPKIACLYMLAAHIEQAAGLNWIAPGTFTLGVGTVPAFAVDRGYTGNGTTSYANSLWNPVAVAGIFAQDSHHLFAYSNTDPGDSTASVVGNNSNLLTPRVISTTFRSRSAVGSNTTSTVAAAGLGLIGLSRNASANYRVMEASGAIQQHTVTSVGLCNSSFMICAFNSSTTAGTTPSGFSVRQVAFTCWGAGLSDAEMVALRTVVIAYLTSIGAN